MSADPSGRRPVIGVVGAYGAVGSAAARWLDASGVGTLRVGGRRLVSAERLVREHLDETARAVAVDVTDPASLAAFVAGCDTVLNCAGPYATVRDRVAVAAHDAGAAYVDAFGLRLLDLPAGSPVRRGDRVALVGAGLMPGLSGLLPRWLAGQGDERPESLTVHVGGLDRISRTSAADFLDDNVGVTVPFALWRHGAVVPHGLAPRFDVRVEHFPRPVALYPVLSAESVGLARRLGLDEGRWFLAFEGTHGLAALTARSGSGEGAACELVRASELDAFGRDPYQVVLAELGSRRPDGRAVTRTAVLRTSDGPGLSGAVAALATEAVSDGVVARGLDLVSDVLDPSWVLAQLRATSVVDVLTSHEGTVDMVEEGVL